MRRIAATLLLVPSCHPAVASPAGFDLPPPCASVTVGAAHELAPPEAGFDASEIAVRLPKPAHGTAASMSAAELRVTSASAKTTEAALERASSASAASLLIGLTGGGHGGCSGDVLRQAARPITDGLGHGAAYVGLWRGVTLRGASGSVAIGRMELSLRAGAASGPDRPVHVSLILHGVTGSLRPQVLLPDGMALQITLPASSLPTLLAATGGGAPDARIPVTIDSLHVVLGDTVLSGSGVATAAALPKDSLATLHLTAHHFDDLVGRAAVLGMVRLHTALFMSSLMGRPIPHGLQWDVSLKDGLMTVNDVPVPVPAR